MPRCPRCFRRLEPGAQCAEDGSVAPTGGELALAAPDETPPELPGYLLQHRLGYGGFATVWAGDRVSDGTAVAVKVAHASSTLAGQRFAAEAAALNEVGARFGPGLLDTGKLPDGRPFVTMTRWFGRSLAQLLLASPAALPIAHARDIGCQLLTALEELHRAGYVHRDLKPDNLWLRDAATEGLGLLDFGLACRHGATTSDTAGSSEYMAPEQLIAEYPADRRSDIYATGIVLYELLTLRVPFVGDRASIERGHAAMKPPPPGQFAPLPSALDQLVLRCLAKSPDDRPQTARELRELWSQAATANSPVPPPLAPPEPPLRPRPRTPPVPTVLLAVVSDLSDDLEQHIARHGGQLGNRVPPHAIYCFSHPRCEDPGQAAVAAARDLLDSSSPRWPQIALHLAQLRVRVRPGSNQVRFYGKAVERPGSWLPPATSTGVLLTNELVRALPPELARPHRSSAGFHTLGAESQGITQAPDAAEPALLGRDHDLARALASARTTMRTGTPTLMTATAGPGLGKSRLLRELTGLLHHRLPGLTVLHLEVARDRTAQLTAVRRLHDELVKLTARFGHHPTDNSSTPNDDPAPSDLPAVRALAGLLHSAAKHQPLALLVDNAHRATDDLLDSLELATLDAQRTALWVVVTTDPRLHRRRRHWGTRAHRHHRRELRPLGDKSAGQLAAQLLHPVEYPPEAALQLLAHWSGGNPRHLRAIVAGLRTSGVVRQQPGTHSWVIDAAVLQRMPPVPAADWMASRVLTQLPRELAACAKVCAVLGDGVTSTLLGQVGTTTEGNATCGGEIDPCVGLRELATSGVLTCDGGRWWFQDAPVRDALYRLVPQADRQRLHSAALAYWQSAQWDANAPEGWQQLARHALAAGDTSSAARAQLVLAELAAGRHHPLEADRHFSAALEAIGPEHGDLRLQALTGRGRARYRLQRVTDALLDLGAARELANRLGNHERCAYLQLEEATALDWAERFGESSHKVASAAELVRRLNLPLLTVRWQVADGRRAWRQQDLAGAIERLTEASTHAAALGDTESQIVSSLLLGPALAIAGRVDEARQRFRSTIALCTELDDRLHLCVAHVNRIYLWSAVGTPARAVADLQRAVELARAIGQPVLERGVSHNLAETLYWMGRTDEALPLAQRAFLLHQKFSPHPVPHDALLLARIHGCLRQWEQVSAHLSWVSDHTDVATHAPTEALLICALATALIEHTSTSELPHSRWPELLPKARAQLPPEEQLELLRLALFSAQRCGSPLEPESLVTEIAQLRASAPLWCADDAQLAASAGLARQPGPAPEILG